MMLLQRTLGIVFICFFLLGPSPTAFANTISGINGTGVRCPSGSSAWGMIDTGGALGCVWNTNRTVYEQTLALWQDGQVWKPISGVPVQDGFQNIYVPFSGAYRIVMHFCPSRGGLDCDLARATFSLTSVKAVQLDSHFELLSQQNTVDFGGFSGKLATASNACFTLKDSAGVEWSSSASMFFCVDGQQLPSKPAGCFLNPISTSLDVDMGKLERGDIGTSPGTGTAPSIKKTISVLCTRDAGINVKMHVELTKPASYGGTPVAESSLNGIGVAVLYKGKALSSTDSFDLNYGLGYSTLDLEFEAIRDPNIPLVNITGGKFSANAVLILTEQ